MKKSVKGLVSVIVVLTLLFSVCIPAFATGNQDDTILISGKPEFPDFNEWLVNYIAENEEIAALLAEYEVSFLEGMSKEEFMAANEITTEEEYNEFLLFYFEYEYYDQFYAVYVGEHRKYLGGPETGIGVMADGKYVAFPDAVPEIYNSRTMIPVRALMELYDAEVDFDDTTKTVFLDLADGRKIYFATGSNIVTLVDGEKTTTTEMDVAPYIKDDRTYVPVRFFSEAIGLSVSWDDDYKTAIIIDSEDLAAAADAKFTVLNNAIKANLVDMEKTYKATSEVDLDITIIDLVNGNISSGVTGKFTGYSKGYDMDLSGSIDMREFIDMLTKYAGEELTEEDKALLEALSVLDFDIIMNEESASLYMKSDALTYLLTGGAGDNLWFEMDMSDYLYIDAEDYSVGSVIYTLAESMYPGIDTYKAYAEIVSVVEMFFGDDQFTKTADGYRLVIDTESLAAMLGVTAADIGADILIDITITSSGRIKAVIEFAVDDGESDVAFGISMDSTATDAKAEMTVSVTNLLEMTVSATAVYEEAEGEIREGIPADAQVYDIEELLGDTLGSMTA